MAISKSSPTAVLSAANNTVNNNTDAAAADTIVKPTKAKASTTKATAAASAPAKSATKAAANKAANATPADANKVLNNTDATNVNTDNNNNNDNNLTNAGDTVNAATTGATTPESAPGDRCLALIQSLSERIARIESTLSNELREAKSEQKTLLKEFTKYQRQATAATNKRRKSKAKAAGDATSTQKTSGLEKPTGISDQLADFLNVSRGTELPRMEVTRRINDYIRQHNLQDPSDRRKIIPDAALHALLGTSPDTVVSYFNYQGFLKGHFVASSNK